MSKDWAEKTAADERRRRQQLQIIKHDKILNEAVVLWDEIVTTIGNKVGDLNHYLPDREEPFRVTTAPSMRIIIKKEHNADAVLEVSLASDTRTVSYALKRAGKLTGNGRFPLDVDDDGNLGLRQDNRVMSAEEVAEQLLEYVIFPAS